MFRGTECAISYDELRVRWKKYPFPPHPLMCTIMYPAKIFRQFSFYIHFKRSVLHKKPWWSIRFYSERYLSSIAFKESSEINDLIFHGIKCVWEKNLDKIKANSKVFFIGRSHKKKDLKDL